MKFDVYFNFDGNCQEALSFYANAFNTKVRTVMQYKDAPPSEEHPLNEADKERIMYADMPLGNIMAMFCDAPAGSNYLQGNTLTPTLGFDNKEEAEKTYAALVDGGEIIMPLAPTFFSELFAMVTDKFGFTWQIILNARN